MSQPFEIRCPIHGFIKVDEWEREIIDHAAFQRLRRIRQLGWTDYIYPGAMHTRFEHSLGVMHTATRLFEAIVERSGALLRDAFGYINFDRHKRIVRLAALLHDLGHGPFSHAAEDLLPTKPNGLKFKHEAYSAAIVRGPLRSTIEDHQYNQANHSIKADEIADLLEDSSEAAGIVFWRELIDSQMDADRMDYLLRDSYHLGVRYGRYDIDRILNTICAVPGEEGRAPRIGVSEGGWHAAESMVLARYYMFAQVYFHKTRVAYDHHIVEAMKAILPSGTFPGPQGQGIQNYLEWDDWRVLGCLAKNEGGDHARRLRDRDHLRMVFDTTEHPSPSDIDRLSEVREKLGDLLQYEMTSSKSWYAKDKPQIRVLMDVGYGRDLSTLSLPVFHIGSHDQTFLYVDRANVNEAKTRMGVSSNA
jgi:uncharacterized protein